MKAHRRQTVEKKFAKVKKSLAKDREHRLEDLKVKHRAQIKAKHLRQVSLLNCVF